MGERTLDDCVRLFLGLVPHDSQGNYCYRDAYFASYCRDRFGKDIWEKALAEAERRNR